MLSIILVHIEEYWGFVDLQFRISLLFWQSTRLTTSDAPCCWTVDWGGVVKNCDAHDKKLPYTTLKMAKLSFFCPFWVASWELRSLKPPFSVKVTLKKRVEFSHENRWDFLIKKSTPEWFFWYRYWYSPQKKIFHLWKDWNTFSKPIIFSISKRDGGPRD